MFIWGVAVAILATTKIHNSPKAFFCDNLNRPNSENSQKHLII